MPTIPNIPDRTPPPGVGVTRDVSARLEAILCALRASNDQLEAYLDERDAKRRDLKRGRS